MRVPCVCLTYLANISTVRTDITKAGSLIASSLVPSSLIERAWNQKDRGGLPQNGVPSWYHGVIQSLLTAINLAISAYLGSVVSAKGNMAAATRRMITRAAGNILWTYALPSLPFTALLIVKLWRSSNAKKVQRAQYIALVVPFTTVLLIALVIYGSIPLNSQKMLIAKALEEGQSMNSIYYLNKTPFSGRFYTNGNATTVDIDSFRHQLDKSDDDLYLIIDNRQFSELGTLQGIHTELLMDNGSYSLYGITRMNTDSAQLSIR